MMERSNLGAQYIIKNDPCSYTIANWQVYGIDEKSATEIKANHMVHWLSKRAAAHGVWESMLQKQ